MPRPKKNTTNLDSIKASKEWWSLVDQVDDAELANVIHDVCATIESHQSFDQDHYTQLARFYLNRNIGSLREGNIAASSPFIENGMTYNVCKMAVDAICAKIAKNQVRVYFLTSEGNFDQQERATLLSAYMDYVFEAQNVYAKAQDIFRSACVFGTGALKVSESDGAIIVEPVRVWDLRIDEVEAIDGQPEQIHHVALVSRSKLKALYPEQAEVIDRAPAFNANNHAISDRVRVIESWHLRSTKSASDGWRTVSVENGILEKSEFPYSRLPFIFTKYTKPLTGFYGISLVEELRGVQRELNEVIEQVRESLRFSVPKALINKNTEVDRDALNDEIGGIVEWDGPEKPELTTPTTVAAQTFQWISDLKSSAFESTGISLLSVAGKKDASLESGAAIAEFMDIESERFALTGLAWEQIFLDLADLVLEFSRALFSGKTKIKLRTSDGRFLESRFWKEIELPEESVELSKYPTPLLPKTPAGATQAAVNLTQGGVTSPEEAKAMLRLPDVGAFYRQSTAPLRICQKLVNNILVHGKSLRPQKYMPLDLLKTVATEAYLDAMVNDSTDPDNLELMRVFLDQLAEEMTPDEQPAPAANDNGMPPEAMPEGEPPPGPEEGAPPGPPAPDGSAPPAAA